MKKVTIFGATGRTGQHLVRKALEAGYEVTAYVRTPSKLEMHNENLTVVQGNLGDTGKVARAIEGADAVLSGLGATRGGSKTVMVPAASSILPAMKQHGAKRLVWATGAGVPAAEDRPALMNKVIGYLLKLTAKDVLEDSIQGVEMVKSSGLDWVIARGPMLTDERGSGQYRAGYVNSDMGRTLSRENFADFMVKQVESDEWLYKMPAVSDL